VGEIGLDEPLPKLAAAANVTLREVGTINRAGTADFEAMASPSTAAILRITPDAYRIVGDTTAAEPESLVALCRDRELRFIDALGVAPLTEPPESIQLPLPSVRERLASGVDLAIVRGDGLVGGPACGILLGDREIIQDIKGHPLFAAWRLDVLRTAALIATLESYDNKPLCPEELPIWQFLTGSIENLRNRAERLAPQLAAASGISTATAIEIRSPLLPAFAEGWPSYGVALTAADGDIRSLDKRLRSGPSPILGRIEGERLILDLRTVLPRQDKSIVDVLLEAPPVGEENASQNGSTP
jgi:L-seryl-tRNA(Ser) seleniumtransferase